MKNLPKNNEESDFLKGLRKIAENSLENDDVMLIQWWCNKYNLPPNHPLLLERYQEDLMIEIMQDQILKEKMNKKNDNESKYKEDCEWEEEITEEHDKMIKKKLSKIKNAPKNNLEKWQKKAKLIQEEQDEFEIDEEF